MNNVYLIAIVYLELLCLVAMLLQIADIDFSLLNEGCCFSHDITLRPQPHSTLIHTLPYILITL